MEVLIKIPEEEYKRWKEDGEIDAIIVRDAIKNGTPLPKGHGELIDAKVAYKKFYSNNMAKVAEEILNEVPTIIEADKGDKG